MSNIQSTHNAEASLVFQLDLKIGVWRLQIKVESSSVHQVLQDSREPAWDSPGVTCKEQSDRLDSPYLMGHHYQGKTE